ncbi:hypothetical protein D3C87_1057370 [compost metagenome]
MTANSGKWLSVAELSNKSNVPESTARRYLGRYEAYFRYDDRQRGRRYAPDSVPVLIFIQNCYGGGMEQEEIESALLKQFPVNAVTVSEPSHATQAPTPILATKDDLEAVISEIRAVREENKQLVKYIDGRLDERDKALTETLRLMLESRKELAAAEQEKEQKKKKRFLFWRTKE